MGTRSSWFSKLSSNVEGTYNGTGKSQDHWDTGSKSIKVASWYSLILLLGLQSVDTRPYIQFLPQDSFLFWSWQLFSSLDNKQQHLLCILCKTLQCAVFPGCHDSTSVLGLFIFQRELVSSCPYKLPQPLTTSSCTLTACSNLCLHILTMCLGTNLYCFSSF